MHLVRRFGGQARRVSAASVLAAVTIVVGACSSDNSGAGPIIPGDPPHNPSITRAAFEADVNLRSQTVRITAPTLDSVNGLGGQSLRLDGESVDFSLVGGDVVTLTTSNFAASAVGAFQPGKVRVTFDINVTNKLSGVQLVGPTVFPAPPVGTTGPILFPYDIAVAVTSGGTGTGGQGNDVIVTLPSYGLVAPSTNWDGSPHNFFNDTGCPAGANDCYRYEEYAGPIGPGSTTTGKQVGFDIDPTVGQFTARLIVAADLQNAGAPLVGIIAGTVSSPSLGNLNGVTVTATAGVATPTGTTAGAGAYSIPNVPTGPASVAITGGLPAGCTNPGSQSTTVTNGATSTVNFSVVCPVPVGIVGGTISFTGSSPSPTGISVVVTPTGGAAQPGVNPNGAGAYSRSNVPVGTGAGSVALSNLPSGCSNPGPGSYTGLTSGGTATVNFTVACIAPPAGYAYVGTAVDNGSTVTISFTLNMSTFNDPLVPDAQEQAGALEGSFTYPTARLQPTACNYGGPGGAGAVLTGVGPNISIPGSVVFSGTNPTQAQGHTVFTVFTCTFNDLGGSTPVSTTTTLTVASDSNGALDFLPHILVTEASAP